MKLETKTDDRGFLYEAFKLPNDGQIFFVNIKPNETRGNHYHLSKTEKFLVVSGSACINTRRRFGELNPKSYAVSGCEPTVISITPGHVHNIISTTEGCVLAVWVDEQFNPDDPDTYPEKF